MERLWRALACILVLVCLALGGAACSDDNETPPIFFDGQVGGDGAADAGVPDGAGGD